MTTLLVFLTALFGAAGDVVIGMWATTNAWQWLVASIPVWSTAGVTFGFLLKRHHYSISMAVVVVVLVQFILVLLWDHLAEHTTLNFKQWIGVVAAIISILLIEMGSK